MSPEKFVFRKNSWFQNPYSHLKTCYDRCHKPDKQAKCVNELFCKAQSELCLSIGTIVSHFAANSLSAYYRAVSGSYTPCVSWASFRFDAAVAETPRSLAARLKTAVVIVMNRTRDEDPSCSALTFNADAVRALDKHDASDLHKDVEKSKAFLYKL